MAESGLRKCGALACRPRRGMPSEFIRLVSELEKLGTEAAKDDTVLSDLRWLDRHLRHVISSAVAVSPAVAERKRRGRIAYLQGEINQLRRESGPSPEADT